MDLVYVTYNSERWIDKCFDALYKARYSKNSLRIYVADNASQDFTVSKLKEWRHKFEKKVSVFEILELGDNLGFGTANNYAAKKGKDSYICFFNIDTEVYEDTFEQLEAEIKDSEEEVGMWELRQFPYEHPKIYNPINGEVSWCSGAAMVVKRDVFEKVNGFDENIFMYGEDVDLSWRIRGEGYGLKYCPKACILHHSYQSANEFKELQFRYGIKNNLLLRYRYGTFRDIVKWYILFIMVFFSAIPKKGLRIKLLVQYLKHFIEIPYWIKTRKKIKGKFLGWEYEYQRDGAYFLQSKDNAEDIVSVIVRTCNRPAVLKEALCCLRRQTYNKVEIIVVEDGYNAAQKMIDEEFADMPIKYYSTGEKVGRSKAGNIGISMAAGKYINFLDDDDVFYNDHIELLVSSLRNAEEKVAYSFGVETAINVKSQMPYVYDVKSMTKRYKDKFDRVKLCHHNYLPIQCVMFEKELFDRLGGLDETLDYLEDWDMWVRYATSTDFICVPKTTSLYRVPYDKNNLRKRQKFLDDALETVRDKHKKYMMLVSVNEIAQLYGGIKFWKR